MTDARTAAETWMSPPPHTDTPPEPPKKTKGQRTKERIVRIAADLFSEQGFNGTSIRDIAAKAGLSHVGVIHHFPTKDDLLVSVLVFRDALLESELNRFSHLGRDQIFTWMLSILEANVRRPESVHLLVRLNAEATQEDHPAREYLVQRYSRLVEALTRHIGAQFEINPPTYAITAEDAARRTIALLDGLQTQWLLMPNSFDAVGQIADHLATLGIRPADHSDIRLDL